MFEKVKGNFGFGCMRLPMVEKEIDFECMNKMVDTFLLNGFNYFDTAHGYQRGKSEIALRECLVKRYDREDYVLVNKLTDAFFKSEEDIRKVFMEQLEVCGVEYFDLYLLHSLNECNYDQFKKFNAYKNVMKLKEEGYINHVGLSFHDSPELLEEILTDCPEVEYVQLQFNYIDYEDPGIASRLNYEVCVKHNKPVIVMEPVKGGGLVNIPEEAQRIFDELNGCSNAGYAIRFAAGFDNVAMVLSGMSNLEQMEDNISFMKDFKPLNEAEMEAVDKVSQILKAQDVIPCTACRYCVDGCPAKIAIPDLFADLNARKTYHDWNSWFYYGIHVKNAGRASDCVGCGKCEKVCPQKLKIRELLKDVAKEFDK